MPYRKYEKPKRPYKNFHDFCMRGAWYYDDYASEWYRNHPGKYPCLGCEGSGKVRHIEDLDPIEGYKLAPLYECNGCGGSGESDPKKFRAAYKKAIDDYRKSLNEFNTLSRDHKTALSKLSKFTPGERKALREMGVER